MVFFNLFLQISLQKLYNNNTTVTLTDKSLKNDDIHLLEQYFINKNRIIPKIGDFIKVGFQIKEGNKERTQFYEGTNIAKKKSGINTSFTTRKTSLGIGVERNFLLHSSKINDLSVKQSSKTRRSKLYFLRKRYGKAARLKQKIIAKA